MRYLVTRAEPDATETAGELKTLGHDVLVSPLSRIIYKEDWLSEDLARNLPNVQAIILTSRNAAKALAELPDVSAVADIPVLAVGDRSADIARKAGCQNVTSAGGSATDLIHLVTKRCRPDGGPLYYLAGKTRKPDLEFFLSRASFAVTTIIVYSTAADLGLSQAAIGALERQEIDGILVYSASSADTLVDRLHECDLLPLDKSVAFHCLSRDVAKTLKGHVLGPIHIAEHPDQGHLLATLALQER